MPKFTPTFNRCIIIASSFWFSERVAQNFRWHGAIYGNYGTGWQRAAECSYLLLAVPDPESCWWRWHTGMECKRKITLQAKRFSGRQRSEKKNTKKNTKTKFTQKVYSESLLRCTRQTKWRLNALHYIDVYMNHSKQHILSKHYKWRTFVW